MSKYQTEILEIKGTDQFDVLQATAYLAGFDGRTRFCKRSSRFSSREYPLCKSTLFAIRGDSCQGKDMPLLSEPAILVDRIYDQEKEKPSDKFILEFDTELVNPKFMKKLPEKIKHPGSQR